MATATKTGFAAMIACEPCDPTTTATARELVTLIRANVDTWYAQKNTPATYVAFTQRNGAVRKRVVVSGSAVHEEVLRILRDEPREPE